MSVTETLESNFQERMRQIGWSELTQIQRKAFPVLLRRKNTLLVAPTGAGKTEAAVIPIFIVLASERTIVRSVRALYITPLRALNRDIFRRIISYAETEGLRAEIRHGDTPNSSRQRMLKSPPDILITTPETLAILLTSPKMRLNLRALEWVVIDELHEIIASERGSHLAVSLERAAALSTKNIIRVGLSATLGEINEASRFLAGNGKKCAVLVDASVRRYDVECRYVSGNLMKVADAVQVYARATRKAGKSILLFTNTRDEAEYLGVVLRANSPDIPIEVHHGSLSKETREETEGRLRTGEAGIVVTTSSLELGLDIGAVDTVIHAGSPRQAVKLIQRIGRSRHRQGEAASGLILTNRIDDELESIALVNRANTKSLEAISIHKNSFDVIAHHLAGLALEKNITTVEEALNIIQRAYQFSGITPEDIDACLRLLERQGVVRYDGETIRRRGPKTYEYYFQNISTIPDIQQFDVIDTSTNKIIGRLDQVFVGEYGEPGKQFVLKGSPWKIVSVNDDKKTLHVEPLGRGLTTIPYWVGELIPVDYYTALEVGRLRNKILTGRQAVSEEQRTRLIETIQTLGVIPDGDSIVVEKRKGGSAVVIHCCFGSKVNQTISMLLSTLISSKTGYLVEARVDPYRILLSSQGALTLNNVIGTLKEKIDIQAILSVAIIGTHILNWKTWYVAKRFGILTRDATYDRRASRLIQDRYVKTPLMAEVLREIFHEKYDLERTSEILGLARDGKMNILGKEVENFSPLAKPILEFASSFSALPLSTERTIIQLVKNRLENAKHRLVCMSCGKWESIVKTKDAPKQIVCPICRSRLIGRTYVSDEELIRVITKRKRATLTADEDKAYLRAWKTSSLIQNFGNRALTVIAGYGIGADTAARVLRKFPDEEELFKEIYRAEKTYVATRGFWDD